MGFSAFLFFFFCFLLLLGGRLVPLVVFCAALARVGRRTGRGRRLTGAAVLGLIGAGVLRRSGAAVLGDGTQRRQPKSHHDQYEYATKHPNHLWEPTVVTRPTQGQPCRGSNYLVRAGQARCSMASWAAFSRASTLRAGSPLPNTWLPATNSSSSCACRRAYRFQIDAAIDLDAEIHAFGRAHGRQFANFLQRTMDECSVPRNQGFTDITSTRSTISSTSPRVCTGVAGLIATPGFIPRLRISSSVRFR